MDNSDEEFQEKCSSRGCCCSNQNGRPKLEYSTIMDGSSINITINENRYSAGFEYDTSANESENENMPLASNNVNPGCFTTKKSKNKSNTMQYSRTDKKTRQNQDQNQNANNNNSDSKECPVEDITKPGEPCTNKTCPYRCRHPKK